MTHNVFSGTLNLTQSMVNLTELAVYNLLIKGTDQLLVLNVSNGMSQLVLRNGLVILTFCHTVFIHKQLRIIM